jgi:hypothetical protein
MGRMGRDMGRMGLMGEADSVGISSGHDANGIAFSAEGETSRKPLGRSPRIGPKKEGLALKARDNNHYT